jgi:hypothetical protein
MEPFGKLTIVGAALLTLLLVVLYGPLFAGFVVASFAFALMFALMALSALHGVEHWWLAQNWAIHRHRRTRT